MAPTELTADHPLCLAGQPLGLEGDGPFEVLRLEALPLPGVPVVGDGALNGLAQQHDEASRRG